MANRSTWTGMDAEMAEQREWIVTARIRGTQSFRVRARNRVEAVRIVRGWSSGELDPTTWDDLLPEIRGRRIPSATPCACSVSAAIGQRCTF